MFDPYYDFMRRYGEVYEATQNKYGAVCGICKNGQKLGVKPGEFEIVEEGMA